MARNDHECKILHMTFEIGFLAFKVDIFSMKIYIVVTDVVNDVTYSCKSVNTRVVITLLSYDVAVFQWITSCDKCVMTTRVLTLLENK